MYIQESFLHYNSDICHSWSYRISLGNSFIIVMNKEERNPNIEHVMLSATLATTLAVNKF